MRIPAGLDYYHKEDVDPQVGWWAEKRSEEEKDLVITSFFTLKKGAKSIEVKTLFDNQSKCHRLRVMFPTGINAKVSNAEAAFDVVEREIDRPEGSPYYETPNPTHPHYRFVEVNDGKAGFAVLNDGLREYEVTDNASRTVAITLLRGYVVSLCTVSNRWEIHPEMELSQCLGQQERRYAIYPHPGDWAEGDVLTETENFNLSLKLVQAGRHAGTLPKQMSFLEVAPSNVVLSAVKQGEDGKSLVVRVFNPTDNAAQGTLKLNQSIKRAAQVSMEEIEEQEIKPVGEHTVPVTVTKKKVVTMSFDLGRE
jgi:alpha-mannosidase